jgi:hypothetical protein
VLAVPSDWTAASTRYHDRIGIVDLDKDVIGARPRSPDRGDQTLPAFIRAQVANGTFMVIGTPLLETPREATSDIALIEGDGIECEILQQARPLQFRGPPIGYASLDRARLVSSGSRHAWPISALPSTGDAIG